MMEEAAAKEARAADAAADWKASWEKEKAAARAAAEGRNQGAGKEQEVPEEGHKEDSTGEEQLSDEERAKATMAQWVKADQPGPAQSATTAAVNREDDTAKKRHESEGDQAEEQEEEPEEQEEDSSHDDEGYEEEEEMVESVEVGDAEEDAPEDPSDEGTEDTNDRGNVQGSLPYSAPNPTRQKAQPQLSGGVEMIGRWINRIAGLFTKAASVPDSEVASAEAAAAAAHDAHTEKNSKLQELEREKKELEGKAVRDYGAGDAFLPLDGRCFSVSVDKYTYEVCPYGSAQQKDGGMSTSLGTFSRFEGNYSAMVFENGQNCWQGPNRSIKVAVTCGAAEVLSAVSEPSRCVYAAKLTTPALCTKEEHERLQAAADAAQAELDGIKDEL
mmetsp:Transcript_461/g.1369  ORF Transcript_461/g.1369 Transcript_461/m.1369 type:complete len:387 (+) Transcript_461:612-1772(+)